MWFLSTNDVCDVTQSRTQSNAYARARMALALGKLNFSCAVIGLTFINRACQQRTGTPKFRGSGCQFPQSQCHSSPRTGINIALGTRLDVTLSVYPHRASLPGHSGKLIARCEYTLRVTSQTSHSPEYYIASTQRKLLLKAMLHGAIFLATCIAILLLRDVN
jgi:hypothetical protein